MGLISFCPNQLCPYATLLIKSPIGVIKEEINVATTKTAIMIIRFFATANIIPNSLSIGAISGSDTSFLRVFFNINIAIDKIINKITKEIA